MDWNAISDVMLGDRSVSILRAVLFLTVGWIGSRVLAAVITRAGKPRMSPQGLFLLRRFVVWGILAIAIVSALREMGFQLGVLLGAAGILTVAIGFASQTSASNLISGLFLIGEQPFRISDVIQIGDLVGEVLSIDLLSVKLRTMDNLFVRVPNETIIKSNVTTITRFPIRRLDFKLSVSFTEDLERVKKLLFELAEHTPVCLVEPLPLLITLGFSANGVDLQFSVWSRRERFLEMRNTMAAKMLDTFRREGINLALPQSRIAAASGSDPFLVRIEAADEKAPD